jgi:hypothetical protein
LLPDSVFCSYDDRFGPAVLVLLLLVVTITSIVLSISHTDWHRHGSPAAVTSNAVTTGVATKASSLQRVQASVMHLVAHLASSTPTQGSFSSLGMLNASAVAGGVACGQLPVTWPPFFRPKGAAFAPSGDTLLLGGDYALARLSLRNLSDVQLLPAAGWSVAGLAVTPAGDVLLGAARPANTLAEYSLQRRTAARSTSLGALFGAASPMTAITAGPDDTLLVAGPDGTHIV